MLFATEQKHESLLYSYFHEFHSELMQIKRQVQDHDWQQNMAAEAILPESLPFRAPLLVLLDRQTIDAAQRGGEHGARLYRKLKYLMVALADEFFLHLLNWDGRELWRKQLLELSVFNSQAAGQKVFEQIETLLKQRDPITLELARVYLIVLSLGFQGRYRNTDEEQNTLFNYRRQLFSFITQRDPGQIDQHLNYDTNLHIFPQAYQHTHIESVKQHRLWLPNISPWYLALLLLFLLLILTSIPLWHWLSMDLNVITDRIIQHQPVEAIPSDTFTQGEHARLQTAGTVPKAAEPVVETAIPSDTFIQEERARLQAETALKAAERRLQTEQQELTTLKQRPQLLYTQVWQDILFDRGAIVPNNIPTEQLDELVSFLQQYPQSQVVIKGYTDNTGTVQINRQISQHRANTVRNLLVERGIAATRISTMGLGETQPIASNATAEGRSRNRRVEITVF